MSGGELVGVLRFLAALAWFVAGIVGMLFAAQAKRRGSSCGTWAVPAVGGTLFILWGLVLLWGWAALARLRPRG